MAFFTQLGRLPLVMVGKIADCLRPYLPGVPPTATITAWLEIPIWKIVMARKYGEEEN